MSYPGVTLLFFFQIAHDGLKDRAFDVKGLYHDSSCLHCLMFGAVGVTPTTKIFLSVKQGFLLTQNARMLSVEMANPLTTFPRKLSVDTLRFNHLLLACGLLHLPKQGARVERIMLRTTQPCRVLDGNT